MEEELAKRPQEEIENLRQRVAELEEENASLKRYIEENCPNPEE